MRPAFLLGIIVRRPSRTLVLMAAQFPTLKRGANDRCAYGARVLILARIPTAGITRFRVDRPTHFDRAVAGSGPWLIAVGGLSLGAVQRLGSRDYAVADGNAMLRGADGPHGCDDGLLQFAQQHRGLP